MSDRCETCLFFKTDTAMLFPHLGFCKRYPPVIIHDAAPNISLGHSIGMRTYTPVVDKDGWCGEYRYGGAYATRLEPKEGN